jgi:5-methylcytosine-specific restriction endonuclease McrA
MTEGSSPTPAAYRDAEGNWWSDFFDLRQPCRQCGDDKGYSVERGGQDVVYCASCRKAQLYNRPKSESGKATRPVTTRAGLKPSHRYRILERCGHACVSCGATDVHLHVGHLLPVEAADRLGVPAQDVNDELNLVALCEECNLGQGKNPASWALIYRALRLHLLLAKAAGHGQ